MAGTDESDTAKRTVLGWDSDMNSQNSTAGGRYKKNWTPSEHYKDTKIAEQYDKERFSSVSGKVFDRLEKAAIRRAFRDLPADSLILDAPSGTGRLAETLLEMGHRVVGLDISPAMLTVAQRKLARFGERYQTRVADVNDLALEPKQFDAALCARVLMHFPIEEQIAFLSAVCHATRRTVVFNQSLDTTYQRLRRQVKRMLGNQAPASFPITPAEARRLIQEAGLIEQARYHVLPLVSEATVFACRIGD